MLLIQSVRDSTVNLQTFANADAFIHCGEKKQVTDYINLTVDLCTWALVRVGGGWGSSLWENEKPTSMVGLEFTASGLIFLGLSTNFKS